MPAITRGVLIGSRYVSCESPADERVRVPVAHSVLGLEVADDLHVLLEAAFPDDLLPVGDRAPILLLDRWEVRRGAPLWARALTHLHSSSRASSQSGPRRRRCQVDPSVVIYGDLVLSAVTKSP